MLKEKNTNVVIKIIVVCAWLVSLSGCDIASKEFKQSRINANEQAVEYACQTIHVACESFRTTHPSYPESLEALASAEPPYISKDLAKGRRHGYIFIYQLSEDGKHFTLDAYPVKVGVTGNRQFSVSDTSYVLGIYLTQPKQETYRNEEYGFSITMPAGWRRVTNTTLKFHDLLHPIPENEAEKILVFFENPDISKQANISIDIFDFNQLPLPPNEDPLKLRYEAMLSNFQKTEKNFKLLNPPRTIYINGREGIVYIFEHFYSTYKTYLTRIYYGFLKDNFIIEIAGTTTPEQFEINRNYFDQTVNSLVID